ncbi:MAG: glycosyltransferase family 4 protein, partial [Bacteroidota bacterium]
GLPSRFMKMEHLGVKGLGFVDSIKPYMNSSSIYIAPLLVGGGVRIKILEAMAMELPVVATSVSAQGIRAGNNEGLIVCDNPAEYAHSVLSLMRNPDRAVKLGKAARNFIINNHTWMRSVKKIYDSYTKLSGK